MEKGSVCGRQQMLLQQTSRTCSTLSQRGDAVTRCGGAAERTPHEDSHRAGAALTSISRIESFALKIVGGSSDTQESEPNLVLIIILSFGSFKLLGPFFESFG